jgi:hypothetical protein
VNHFLQPFHRVFLAVLFGSMLLRASAFATPAEEITRAIAANGISDVSQARPRQFSKAFNAVALRIAPRDLPDYVAAAVSLRPDLAPHVVAVAVKAAVRNWEAKPHALCGMIQRIVKAAIAVNPEAAPSVAKASASVWPELRRCAVEAAISAAPESKEAIVNAVNTKSLPYAFLTFSASDTSGFSFTAATLNPANISDIGDDSHVTSPEQPPSR